MTEPALIEALRRKAGEDVDAIWQVARADAARAEADHDRAIEARRDAEALARHALTADLERTTVATAERTARATRAAATAELAARMRRLAAAALPQFRNGAYEATFAALAAELPACGWERVRVHPDDVALASRHVPAAAVAVDSTTAGGLEVEAERGCVRVSNTLETRLAAAWPDLLPGMVSHVVADLERA